MEVSDCRLAWVQRYTSILSLLLVVLPTPIKAASSVQEGKLPRGEDLQVAVLSLGLSNKVQVPFKSLIIN